MPRTLNPIAHAVRRDAFLDAAQKLIITKGYESLSIQDVLIAVGASRGAFYHYFDSKAALLEAVVERMVEGALVEVDPALADPTLSATQKLQAFTAGIARFKSERRDFMLALIQVWLSDENAIVRDKLRRSQIPVMTARLAPVVAQGVAEGSYHVSDEEATARVFVTLLFGLNETATELYLRCEAGEVSVADVERQFAAFSAAFSRILGAGRESVILADPAVLRDWYGAVAARTASPAMQGSVA
jgi:AcrR family transcriptional regulator